MKYFLAFILAVLLATFTLSPASVLAAPRAAHAIEINDTGFVIPDELPGGLVTLTFTNGGQAGHIPVFARLKDGETPDSFAAAGEGALALIEDLATAGFLPPGMSDSVIAELTPGTWIAVDQVDPTIPPTFVTVTSGEGDGTQVPADAPEIGMFNFAYVGIPAPVNVGKTTWKLVNNGTQPHEVALYQLEEGVTPQDFLASFDGNSPPRGIPFGTAATTPGDTIWKEFTLTPGNYLAVCLIPDAESGAPHAQLGMMATFTISDAPATLPQTGSTIPWYLALLGWSAVALIAGLTLRALIMRTKTS